MTKACENPGNQGRAAVCAVPSSAARALFFGAAVLLYILASPPAPAAPAPVVLSGPEVVKLNWGARSLQAADIDGDGLTDIIVINNDRATIDILYQRKPGQAPVAAPRSLNQNRWEPVLEDARFRKDSVVAGVTMYDLAAGDLNGDGLADLAHTGATQALTVRFQQKDGSWTERKMAGAPAANQLVGSLRIIDLDGDGRNELVFLGQKELAIYRQLPGDRFDTPERHVLPDDNSHGLEFCDIDGDGLADIIYLCGNPRATMRARLQTASHQFGPELSYEITPSRCTLQILSAPEGGRPASFAMARDGTGQLEEFALEPQPFELEDAPPLRPRVFSPRPGAKAPFAFATGNFTGALDGPDIAVSDPDGAQVLLYARQSDGGFTSAEKFPSLAEGRAIAAGDWDGDGRDELFVGSAREQAVGVARFADGRFSYPQPLPVAGRPLDLAFGDIAGDGRGILAVLLEDGGSRRVELWARKDDGAELLKAVEITGLKTDPRSLRLVDANQDGLLDLAVFTPLDSMRLFTQNADTALEFSEASASAGFRRGLVDKLEASAFTVADINGDGRAEMIVSSGGFARALRLDGGGGDASLAIVDQFNAAPGADITATLVLPMPFGDSGPGQARPLVALHDRKAGEFQLLRAGREGGVYAPAGSVKTGRIDITGAEVIAQRIVRFNATMRGPDSGSVTGRDRGERMLESFVFGKDRFWWLPATQSNFAPATQSTHTTDLPGVSYADVIAGDLNNDGKREVVCVDPVKNLVEILAREDGGQWRSMMHFKVFETDEHFQGRSGGTFEPRETVIADVTGDGKNDLVLLVHDRVLVYPQD